MGKAIKQEKSKWVIKINDILTYTIFVGLIFDIPYIKHIFSFARWGEIFFLVLAFALEMLIILNTKYVIRNNMLWLLAFSAYLLCITVVRDKNIIICLNAMASIVIVCAAFSINKDWMTDGTLLRWLWFLGIVVCIDLMTQLLYPNGLYSTGYDENWFLGYKTNRMMYSLPLLIFINLRYAGKKRLSIFYYFLVGLVLINMYLSDGVGGLITMIIYEIVCVSILLHYHRKIELSRLGELIFYYPLFLLGIATFFLLVVVSDSNEVLRMLTSVFSNKSITLSGRTNIWSDAITWLNRGYWWTGGGYLSTVDYAEILRFKNPHNQVLSYVMSCGFIGVGLFVGFLYTSIRHLKKVPQNAIMIMGIYCVGVLGMISSTLSFSPLFFAFFFVLSNSRELQKSKMKKRKNNTLSKKMMKNVG